MVDDFVVDGDWRITDVVLRHGPGWEGREVVIPLARIDRVEGNTIYLALDKRGVADLPARSGSGAER